MTAFLRCARHAQLPAQGRCYGRLDLPAAEDPRQSASRLCRTLDHPPLAVWTSPLRRCSEVAGQLALQTGAALRTDERLMEMDFGDWEGRAWEEIETQQPGAYQSWMIGWRHLAPPRGEPLAVFEERVRSWLRERARCRELESSVLIGHAGVIRALRVLGGESSWDDALEKAIPHLVWLHVSISDGSRS